MELRRFTLPLGLATIVLFLVVAITLQGTSDMHTPPNVQDTNFSDDALDDEESINDSPEASEETTAPSVRELPEDEVSVNDSEEVSEDAAPLNVRDLPEDEE